jgi:D-glycero-D-manno-heptose 1,7-bisphosphate phosphatase
MLLDRARRCREQRLKCPTYPFLAIGHERPVFKMNRAVFLDRDGVINRSCLRGGKPYAPRGLEDFRLLPGAAQAVKSLKKGGFLVIVVTNQPDIGNGLVRRAVVEAMHAKLRAGVPVDDIWICPHRQDEGCDCRKPKPGMLLDAAAHWNIDLKNSYMVGDRDGDIVAGKAAGCYTLLINRHYSEPRRAKPDRAVRSLPAGVRFILAQQNP